MVYESQLLQWACDENGHSSGSDLKSISLLHAASKHLFRFFFSPVLSDPKALVSPEDQRICLVSLCGLRYVNIVTVFLNILF